MKTNFKQLTAAVIVIIFTSVTIFSITAKSDTKLSNRFKTAYEQSGDSSDTNNNPGDTTDGSGGAGFPPKE